MKSAGPERQQEADEGGEDRRVECMSVLHRCSFRKWGLYAAPYCCGLGAALCYFGHTLLGLSGVDSREPDNNIRTRWSWAGPVEGRGLRW